VALAPNPRFPASDNHKDHKKTRKKEKSNLSLKCYQLAPLYIVV